MDIFEWQSQEKKHTDVTESTDLSFSRIFLIYSIDLCVLSIPLIMWWFNGFWASSFLAQDFNASMTPLASESVSITTQWNNRVKNIREKTNPCHQRNPCVFLTTHTYRRRRCVLRLLSFDFPDTGKVCQLCARLAACIAWIMNYLGGVVERDARPPIANS